MRDEFEKGGAEFFDAVRGNYDLCGKILVCAEAEE